MRYRDLKYYFAERLVELYDWDSIDSYRVRSHNAFTLIKELLEVTDNWLKKNIKDFDRVKKCAEETLAELKEDEVIDFSFYSKELFEADLHALIENDKNKNQEVCQQVIYMLSRCIDQNNDFYLDTLYYRIAMTIRHDEKIADCDLKKEIDGLNRLTMGKQSFRSAHEILIYPKIVVPLSQKNLRLWLKKHEMSITNRW